MDLLYIFGLVLLVSSLIVYFLLKRKNNNLNKILNEKQIEIEKNIDDLKSGVNSFEERFRYESREYKTIIKESKLNIESLNQTIKREENTSYMKNVFLTNVSNEIRNPLNGIMGFANVLRTDLAKLNRDDLYEFANSISESGESLLRLLNDIFDISRLEVNDVSFELHRCDLKKIISTAVNNYEKTAKDKGLQLVIDNNLDYHILSDYEAISRIANSIIDNAIKFTDKGYIKLSILNKDDEITIIIKDTGIGIDPSYIPLIFEPYRSESLGYSTKYQGAGLSLPLAKKALALMKGDILIESEKGKGTTVNIILKKATQKDTPSKSKIKKEIPKTKELSIPWYKKNVFLVEDDKINQILFTKLLVGCNNLVIADSGEDALKKLADLIKEDYKIDFVLMDINLPGDYNGISLMHKMKQKYEIFENIPFIAQTAYAMSNDREKLMDEGFNEYLSKPIRKTELSKIVEEILQD
jgi:signal transduction histidine kinase